MKSDSKSLNEVPDMLIFGLDTLCSILGKFTFKKFWYLN